MKKVRTSLIILFVAAVLILGWYFMGGFPETIGPGEVGVVVQGKSAKKVYHPGERPVVIPLLQGLCRIRTSPELVSFTGEEALRSGDLGIESQVIYRIVDPANAVESFGSKETEQKIRKKLNEEIIRLLKAIPVNASLFADDEQRMMATAEVHVGLRKAFEGLGVSVESYQLRVR